MPEPITDPAAPTGDPAPLAVTPPVVPAPGTTPPAVNLDGPYDEARGTQLIANLRAELAAAKAKRQTPAADDDLRARLDAMAAELATSRAAAIEAAKTAAIAEAKVPAHLAGYVNGATPEEIKASAEKVAADFTAGQPPADEDPLPGLPRPALTPGRASADAVPAFDPAAVAAQARRGY